MKSSFDIKHNTGKITPENNDDLFILSNIVRPGDLVTTKTLRSVEVERGDKKEKLGKKPVVLTLLVEKVELSENLRIGGKIVEGPEDIEHAHHSFNIKHGDFLTIRREWKSWELNKIKAAQKPQENVIAIILDDRDCDFYLIRDRVKHLIHVKGGASGKQGEKNEKPEYFKNIITELKRKSEQYDNIVIAGPGFAKEDLENILKQKEKELLKGLFFDKLNHVGKPGLNELLKRGILQKIVKTNRLAEESELVEKLMMEIMKEGKVVYGLEETRKAIEMGAVELLLISDSKVRELEEFMKQAEKSRVEIKIIDHEHEEGEKFMNLGGVAGFLRYKIR